MKGDSILKKIIFSSGFLAFIPALLIMFFLHPLSSKYSLSVEPTEKHIGQFIYSDLNSDSISEIVYSGKGLPYYFIGIRDINERFYDQWNLSDSLEEHISDIFFGDFDHDRFEEIYVFTHNGDSLFLNVNEILGSPGTRLDRIFITNIGFINGVVTSTLKPAGFYDHNGDGKDELYFGITTGFRQDPRRLYCFDLVNKKLFSSPFTGIICMEPKMYDIDGDMRPEFFGTMSACGNFGKKVPYSDSSTWFMVFNDSLKFEFPPVEFPGYVNSLEIKTYKNNTDKGFILEHWAAGTDSTVLSSRILIYSPQGKLIRFRLLEDIGVSSNLNLFITTHNQSDKIYIVENKILELNDRLEVIRTIDLPFHSKILTYQINLSNGLEDDFLIYSEEEEKLVHVSSGLDKLAEIEFKLPSYLWKFSHYYAKDHTQKLFLSSGEKGYFLKLNKNKYFYLGFIAYPGIYLLFFLFIILIKRINTWQVEQKESLKRRLITLQLQGIKSQFDPHFTFNTLNSVASLIYLEDRQTAYDYMIKFTQLLRGMLNDAERIYRSLGEELEFVTTYLDLEKLRFGEKFNYTVEIGEGVNQSEQVPKLVLQTFAENAIKHGLMHKADSGILKIKAEIENDYLKLTIEDNGIGREKSAGQSTSTGKGLKITGEFYEILNQINIRPIKHLITDLYAENGVPAGTRVEVWVPAEME